MTLVYQTIHAALLPVRLHDVPKFIGAFLDHLGHRNERKRPKQTALFRAKLQAAPAPTSPDASARPPPVAA